MWMWQKHLSIRHTLPSEVVIKIIWVIITPRINVQKHFSKIANCIAQPTQLCYNSEVSSVAPIILHIIDAYADKIIWHKKQNRQTKKDLYDNHTKCHTEIYDRA